MPTIGVDKAELFKALGQEWASTDKAPRHVTDCYKDILRKSSRNYASSSESSWMRIPLTASVQSSMASKNQHNSRSKFQPIDMICFVSKALPWCSTSSAARCHFQTINWSNQRVERSRQSQSRKKPNKFAHMSRERFWETLLSHKNCESTYSWLW